MKIKTVIGSPKTVLLRNTIIGSRKNQEASQAINVRTRVIQDKTKYTRQPKHKNRSIDF